MLPAPPIIRNVFAEVFNRAEDVPSLDIAADEDGAARKGIMYLILLLAYVQMGLGMVGTVVEVPIWIVMRSVLHIWTPWMLPILMTFSMGPIVAGLYMAIVAALIPRLPPGTRAFRWLLNISPLIGLSSALGAGALILWLGTLPPI